MCNHALLTFLKLSNVFFSHSADMKNNQGKFSMSFSHSFSYGLIFNGMDVADFAEEMVGEVIIPPGKKLEDLIRLSELCVDLLRQNEEFYAEVSLPHTVSGHAPSIAVP